MAAARTVDWRVTAGLTAYADAVATMDARAAAIRTGEAPELVWLVEHPPLYTAGTSANPAELIDARFPVHASGRGGRYTYHGPGQRVVYAMIDLDARGRDVRGFVHALEDWAITALGDLDVTARAIPGRVGIWTRTPAGDAKIGAIGVRVRRWVTTHGMAINVDPALDHFGGIVPCGLAEPVTSLAALGNAATTVDLDARLQNRLGAFVERLDLKMNP